MTDPSREELEAEREFLLRSLDDLDAELLAGNIDPESYRVLHDDYTARAAAVIRTLGDGVPRPAPDTPRATPALRVVTVAGIVVFGLLAAFLLTRTLGERHPGQTITGNAQVNGNGATPTTGSPGDQVSAAKAAVDAQPQSYDARIRYARALTGASQYADAIVEFGIASQIDSSQPEPLAYGGWISALIGRDVTDPGAKKTLLDAAHSGLDRAIALDPSYTDAYVFKGLLLSQIDNKPCAAVPQFQKFLVLAPSDHPMRSQVLNALAAAVTAGKCPTATTTTAPRP